MIAQIEPSDLINNPNIRVEDLCGDARELAEPLVKKAKKLSLSKFGKWTVLLIGDPGCGKSALAEIAANTIAEHRENILSYSGINVDVDLVRQWQRDFRIGSLYSGWRVLVIEEIDTVPARAQDLMLDVIDKLPECVAIIGTSNNHTENFSDRFQTRFTPLEVKSLTSEEIHEFAMRHWPRLDPSEVRKIAEGCNGNMRAALHDLQSLCDGF
ncbi:AAA family ATPase [Rubellicoccus peritrichatus]|uniref:AAA family ATPase n=1 Tax=Rubellicoccus peritrichatus TaxID=3080537 RepID=A0AAQ3LBM7_9BACT|nr:AAA family ATPase [Puniceicoccus sp. CR14]WOO40400.1 AAA family ATPase [Puniceicoccus sp. CR14]WOO40449.1 AAA family ATPase [Puniceicoccus sp. CR14]WOO40498.1 AAA family ATPase [Puniceicoccus sp. CR14]WOO40548.1 AAA family ATPase [Puniceicoccus sp. CR14]